MKAKKTLVGELGVYDGSNRVYSLSNPPTALATAITNTSANTVYPDNASYFKRVVTTDSFPVNGMLSGIRVGTAHTQRLQDETTGNTLARYWIDGSTAWSAWSQYLDAQDYTTKGDLHVATGANAFSRQGVGADGTVLTADSTLTTGVKWATPTGGSSGNVQAFTASGTWTKPAGCTTVQITCIGAGGGGGSGRTSASGTAGGGGSGAQGGGWSQITLPASVLSATETVTVGTGGAGGTAQATASSNGRVGTIGGDTKVGVGRLWCFAGGGGPGNPGTTTTASPQTGTVGYMNVPGGGGNGNATTGSPGVSSNNYAASGGAGGAGFPASPVAAAGGQGGNNGTMGYMNNVANPGASGNNAGGAGMAPNTNYPGGGGGGGGGGTAATATAAGAGGAGGYPGGGGGGGAASLNGTSGAGGAGANGFVLIVAW